MSGGDGATAGHIEGKGRENIIPVYADPENNQRYRYPKRNKAASHSSTRYAMRSGCFGDHFSNKSVVRFKLLEMIKDVP